MAATAGASWHPAGFSVLPKRTSQTSLVRGTCTLPPRPREKSLLPRGTSHVRRWPATGPRRIRRGHGTVAALRPILDLPPIPRSFPELPDPVLPPYQKVTLSNGLRLFVLEDRELGLVAGQLCVKGGAKLEPASQVGLSAILSSVQRSGGTRQHPEDQLDDILEDMAASVECGSSTSEVNVGFQCLPGDLPTVMDLFAQVTLSPRLPSPKLELVRAQVLGALARKNDDPGRVASRKMREILYGRESPYARTPTEEGVQGISLGDLRDFHRLSFCDPGQAVLGIWGDVSADDVIRLVDRHLGSSGWAPRQLILPQPETTNRQPVKTASLAAPGSLLVPATQGIADVAGGGADVAGAGAVCELAERAGREGVVLEEGFAAMPLGLYGVDVPGLTQGYVRFGELGTTLADEDVFSLDVLNSILNGFGGRLFDRIRSQQGLAYSVSGSWSPSLEHRGSFVAGGETQLDNIIRFMEALSEVLGEATVKAPSEEELSRAKDSALNSFVFNFANTGAQMQRILSYELYGIDQNFPFLYKQRVQSAEAGDILQAARRKLHPQEHRILVVSDFSRLEPQLQAAGLTVSLLDTD